VREKGREKESGREGDKERDGEKEKKIERGEKEKERVGGGESEHLGFSSSSSLTSNLSKSDQLLTTATTAPGVRA